MSFDERDRRSIVGDLESADPEVRRLATERLSLWTGEEGLALLLERLGDPSPPVQEADTVPRPPPRGGAGTQRLLRKTSSISG